VNGNRKLVLEIKKQNKMDVEANKPEGNWLLKYTNRKSKGVTLYRGRCPRNTVTLAFFF
jgi:hypothetical protein